MSNDSIGRRRVALVASAGAYAGPATARVLARRGHDLVLGDPAPDLVDELEAEGAAVAAVEGVEDLADEHSATRLVEATLGRFGRLDAATMASGVIVTGRFADATVHDLHRALRGCVEAPFRFLQAVVPVMVEAGGGQVLVQTSAAGARATPGAPLYSAARAGANHLVRNVAHEVARHGVQVNAVGTNFMDFPGFLEASRADTPEGRARVEALVPMRRLGTLEEFAAFCAVFLDGTSGFTTGQFVPYAGGWA
jgi:NAD(P)-dependent dehydrogenase (short-subunit alcohol dehydrogenase family)